MGIIKVVNVKNTTLIFFAKEDVTKMKTVGFIGLGTMGLPMAKNILKKNGALVAADLMDAPKEEMKGLGAEIAADNADAAGKCDILFLSLPTVKAVEMVMLGKGGLLEAGKEGMYIVDTSTIGYKMSKEICEAAEEKGIHYVDCPISGGAGKASDGTLSIICGGTLEELKEAGVADLLDMIGNNVHYTGTRGGGVALKIINNMLSKSILFADGEAILMAEHMGIPFETLYNVIQSSSSQNEILRIKSEHIQNHEYDPTGKSYSPITMSLKDLGLARELGDELGISNFNCNNVIQWYRIGMQRGYEKKDSSSIVELLRELEPPKYEA